MTCYIITNKDFTKAKVIDFLQEGIDTESHLKEMALAMYEESGNKTEEYTVYPLGGKVIQYLIDRQMLTTIKETTR